MEIFACRASKDFACKVIESINANLRPDELPKHLGDLQLDLFSDGEFQPLYAESVRGATAHLFRHSIHYTVFQRLNEDKIPDISLPHERKGDL